MPHTCSLVSDFFYQSQAQLVPIGGIPFADLDFHTAVQVLRKLLTSEQDKHWIVLANAHTVNLALDDPAYHASLRNACLVLRDGIGISIAARLLGGRLDHNFVGTDFVPRALYELAPLMPRIFLYGARPGRAEAASGALQRQCRDLKIVGCNNGYTDSAEVIEEIAEAKPDILLVALGNPTQEKWIVSHMQRLPVRVAIGVGALFDYLAGAVPRAPSWVRRARSEWIYRITVEPKRLWRRYIFGNPVFLSRVALQAARSRLKSVTR